MWSTLIYGNPIGIVTMGIYNPMIPYDVWDYLYFGEIKP